MEASSHSHSTMLCLGFLRLLCVIMSPALCQAVPTAISNVQPGDCTSDQFYNIATFSCNPCSANAVSGSGGLTCNCNSGFVETDLGSPLVTCTKCDSINLSVSFDQTTCLTCAAPNCTCGSNQVREENFIDNTYTCVTCSGSTVPNSIGNQCVPCQQTFLVNNCNCPQSDQSGGLCFHVAVEAVSSSSIWEILYLYSSYQACNSYSNVTACQLLTNTVILNAFSWDSTAFTYYNKITNTFLPKLFYNSQVQLGSTAPTGLSYTKNSQVQFRIVKYDARGAFLGWENLKSGTLQLCSNTQSFLGAAFKFGTVYNLSCTLQVSDLMLKVPEPVFYELFLAYTDSSGASMLWPIPVWNENLQASTSSYSTQAIRRFFLVDTLLGRQSSLSSQPSYVTVATRFNLSVYLPTASPGTQPPFQLTVKYERITNLSGTVQVSFGVSYTQSAGTYKTNTDIALGVLGSLGTLYAILETSSWMRRSGQQNNGLMVIVKFLAFLSGSLANTFFLIVLGTAIYWLIAFKGQNSTITVTLPPAGGKVETDFITYLAIAFALKTLELLHLLVTQLTVTLFLIDWEKSKEKNSSGQGKNVSVWRTILVANEWNEIQAHRKLSPLFQLFFVLLLLEVVGLKNITGKDLNLDLNPASGTYIAPWSIILRFGIAASMWLAVGIVQILFFIFIYERFFEDKIRQFADLCSLSNVSVFILTHKCYGYYIHGRSVHGQADVNMETLLSNLQKEEENLCPLRGLEPNSDNQMFEVLLSDRVREQYEKIMEPLQEVSMRQKAGNEKNPFIQQRVKTYYTLNRFLSSFVDHVYKDMDYIVKDKLFLESIADIEFQQPIEKSFFYTDDRSRFSRTLFYGNELTLLLFDTLLFCIVDLGTQNFVLATIITFAVQMIVRLLRLYFGKKNLSTQTMVEEIFLI
ncbi:meckelin-like isoform X1 [Pelobates cultripes]|uniref:Meckelin-like isoform X1 n=1 Tax=Pelobates cultripes TaxID=61616 RepID=A0AAD1TCX9_PELCU|nr:meckelin-like isoform X1 [Pelobates cultripes]